MYCRNISIKRIEKPNQKDFEKDIGWICDSLGLSSGRDIQETSKRILSSILKSVARNESSTVEEISDDLDLNASIINHHLRNMMISGILYRKKKEIFLRGGTLKNSICEIKKDFERMFEEVESIAKDVDDSLGIVNRA